MLDTYELTKHLVKEGKLSEKAAASIAQVIFNSVHKNQSGTVNKQDLQLLKKDISYLEEKMNVRFEDVATKEDQEKVFTQLSATQTNLIKWLIGISITITTALITSIYYLIKYWSAIQPVVQKISE